MPGLQCVLRDGHKKKVMERTKLGDKEEQLQDFTHIAHSSHNFPQEKKKYFSVVCLAQ